MIERYLHAAATLPWIYHALIFFFFGFVVGGWTVSLQATRSERYANSLLIQRNTAEANLDAAMIRAKQAEDKIAARDISPEMILARSIGEVTPGLGTLFFALAARVRLPPQGPVASEKES